MTWNKCQGMFFFHSVKELRQILRFVLFVHKIYIFIYILGFERLVLFFFSLVPLSALQYQSVG